MLHTRATAFLKSYGLDVAAIDPESLLQEFLDEMRAGLTPEKSSLMMIPAFIRVDRPVPVNQPVIVMDVGGTHLRVALASFDAAGQISLEAFRKFPMPGTQGELSAAAFFDQLAGYLRPVAGRAGHIGLCFSYPMEITPACDGRLLEWTKQVQAPEVVGCMIGEGILSRLRDEGFECRISVLNDTVATLLAGRSAGLSRQYDTYVGFILGTGTNTAYVEQNSAITKRDDLDPNSCQVINVESGNFGRCVRSEFDVRFDARTADPGSYVFEKMISGAYLGGVGLEILRQAGEESFFSAASAAVIASWRSLHSKDFDDFVDNPFLTGTEFDAAPLTDDDRRAIIALCTPVFERAALLTAVNISAAVIKAGGGRDPLHPTCVTVDGSTYYKTRTTRFKSVVEGHLRRILGGRGLSYDLLQMADAPIVGAAVAGLMQA